MGTYANLIPNSSEFSRSLMSYTRDIAVGAHICWTLIRMIRTLGIENIKTLEGISYVKKMKMALAGAGD